MKKVAYAVFNVCLHFVNKQGVEEELAFLFVVTSGRGKKQRYTIWDTTTPVEIRALHNKCALTFQERKEVCDFDDSYSVLFHDHILIRFPSN